MGGSHEPVLQNTQRRGSMPQRRTLEKMAKSNTAKKQGARLVHTVVFLSPKDNALTTRS